MLEPGSAQLRRLRPALGTLLRIQACGFDAASAIDAAYSAVADVEAAMSFHRDDSELRELLSAPIGEAIEISSGLWRVLSFARRLWQLSGGAFDPCVAAQLVHEQLLPRPTGTPPPAEASFGDLQLPSPGMVVLQRPLWFDLGGIAKGYAVDCALTVLREAGMNSASVNAGGDMACFGEPQTVWLRDPREPQTLCHAVELHDAALATSATYFQPRALRSRSGALPRRRRGSVTVLAPDCMTADALTKICWVAPRSAATLLVQFNARALDLDADANLRWRDAA